jgi:3-hydroxybutyryl-CoA dehydrogenase
VRQAGGALHHAGVVNRLLIPLINDAVCALDEIGIEPAEIDLAMTNGADGPFGDRLIGVDVHVHAAEAVRRWRAAHGASASPAACSPPAAGRKTGRGFYDYRAAEAP